MKISIVTISFNQAHFLERCILSILEQKHKHKEVEYIVVDPGSTDGSRKIIEKYQKNINKVVYEPDNGPADGLNNGFSYATGEIYGFLNADDVLNSGSLSSVASYFEMHPNIDVISGHTEIIDENDVVLRRFYSDRFNTSLATYGASILAQQSTFFRSSVFKKTDGFNVENKIAWDGELYLDMALTGASFKITSEFWSQFRIHKNGITGSGKLSKLYKVYHNNMFYKVKGRNPNVIDIILRVCAGYIRKILNPLDTIERLRHGAIYKAASKKET
tara:strand:+ start:1859 stop:2680 length:822 start_codon:yes stop_codon:yes gene_type:complete